MPSSESELPSFELELQRREQLRLDLTAWAVASLGHQGLAPAAHHRLLLRELEAISRGDADRLLVLMPPGSAKSTYAILNMLLGSLAAMATSVVSYWVGSSAGSARKDEHIAQFVAGQTSSGSNANS